MLVPASEVVARHHHYRLDTGRVEECECEFERGVEAAIVGEEYEFGEQQRLGDEGGVFDKQLEAVFIEGGGEMVGG